MKNESKNASKIMIVEDNPWVYTPLVEILEERGYETSLKDNLLGVTAELDKNGSKYGVLIIGLSIRAMDAPDIVQRRVLENDDLAGCAFYDEVVVKNYNYLADKTIFFASTRNIVPLGWYAKHKMRIVLQIDHMYLERFWGLMKEIAPEMVENADKRTEESKMQQEKQRIAEELEEKNLRMRELIEAVTELSHDMRTPLNYICTFPDMILENDELKDERHKNIRDMAVSLYDWSSYLSRLVEDLLDYNSITENELKLKHVDYETEKLFLDIVRQNGLWFKDTPVKFSICVDESIPARLRGDYVRIMRLVSNIVSNAKKYTKEGSVVLSAFISNNHDGKTAKLVFTVKDTGIGMTEKQKDKLFLPFERFADDSYPQTGTGIGMNIVKNLVELMRGSLEVESVFGKGTEITVCIPQEIVCWEPIGRERADKIETLMPSERIVSKIEHEPMSDKSALVVDDVNDNITVLSYYLSRYKLRIDTARSGREVIGKIKAGRKYDIIFLDYHMSEMNGREILCAIRNLGYDLPVVAVSGDVNVLQKKEGLPDNHLSEEFDGLILKPIIYELSKLDYIVKKFVDHRLGCGELWKPLPEYVIKKIKRDSISDIVKKTGELKIALATRTNKDLPEYEFYMHSIKNSLDYLGERELSKASAQLVRAWREKNVIGAVSETLIFIESIQDVVEKHKADKVAFYSSDSYDEDPQFIANKLLAASQAFLEHDNYTASRELCDIRSKNCSHNTLETIDRIEELQLVSKNVEAADVCKEYADKLSTNINKGV